MMVLAKQMHERVFALWTLTSATFFPLHWRSAISIRAVFQAPGRATVPVFHPGLLPGAVCRQPLPSCFEMFRLALAADRRSTTSFESTHVHQRKSPRPFCLCGSQAFYLQSAAASGSSRPWQARFGSKHPRCGLDGVAPHPRSASALRFPALFIASPQLPNFIRLRQRGHAALFAGVAQTTQIRPTVFSALRHLGSATSLARSSCFMPCH